MVMSHTHIPLANQYSIIGGYGGYGGGYGGGGLFNLGLNRGLGIGWPGGGFGIGSSFNIGVG